MTKKTRSLILRWGLFVFFYLILSFLQKEENLKVVGKDQNPIFYEKISSVYFQDSSLPCLKVKIEEKYFPVLLDIGFQGTVSLRERDFKQIGEKSYKETASMYGFRGNLHKQEIYKIPKINIGDLTFHNPTLAKANPLLLDEGNIFEGSLPEDTGLIGLLLFKNTALYLDLCNSHVAICDSISTFEDKEGPLDAFTKIPLLSTSKFVEFSVMTEEGLLQCLLDSGATSNFIHRENYPDPTFEELLLNRRPHVHFSKFKIEGRDFGPTSFFPLQMKMPSQVQAILGMEFLLQHRVLIDFKNRHIYLASR